MRVSTAKALCSALLVFLCVSGCASIETEPHLVAYLVRHAEKATGPDPALTDAGHARAVALVDVMQNAGIDTVMSSDYRRTRDTALPIASALDLELEFYDPRDLAGLAEMLTEKGGRVLVVGHSNTTPELARLLGGDPGSPIDETTEYDRLYVVTVHQDARVSTELRRYGGN